MSILPIILTQVILQKLILTSKMHVEYTNHFVFIFAQYIYSCCWHTKVLCTELLLKKMCCLKYKIPHFLSMVNDIVDSKSEQAQINWHTSWKSINNKQFDRFHHTHDIRKQDYSIKKTKKNKNTYQVYDTWVVVATEQLLITVHKIQFPKNTFWKNVKGVYHAQPSLCLRDV